MNKALNIKTNHGFTLIEIMMAITIFAIGLLAVISMQISSIKGNSSANGLTEATSIAQGQMENLLSLDDNNPQLDDKNGDGVDGLDNASIGTADEYITPFYKGSTGINYNIFWNNTVNSTTNFRQTRVIVQWTQNGRSRKISVDSIK